MGNPIKTKPVGQSHQQVRQVKNKNQPKKQQSIGSKLLNLIPTAGVFTAVARMVDKSVPENLPSGCGVLKALNVNIKTKDAQKAVKNVGKIILNAATIGMPAIFYADPSVYPYSGSIFNAQKAPK